MGLPEFEHRSRAGLRFEFQSITTLDPTLRQYIWDHMTWDVGSMRGWLNKRSSRRRLCLVYNHTLVTWACLGLGEPHDISAWTIEKYRQRGYARAAIWALLDKERISRNRGIQTYSDPTRRVVRQLGYKAK